MIRRLLKKRKLPPVEVEPLSSRELIYAIGDVHGRHDLLLRLISIIEGDIQKYCSQHGWGQKITIVFLGDYVDRGLESKDVIETLLHLDVCGAKNIFLKGNHEQVLSNFLTDAFTGLEWAKYGGRETLSSYGIDLPIDIETFDDWESIRSEFVNFIPPYHMLFFRSLESYVVLGRYMFVHAGINPDKPLDEQSDKDYLWVREKFLNSTKKLPYVIVHGHTPESKPYSDGRRIGIDTGAYISNTLTAVRLVNNKVDFLLT